MSAYDPQRRLTFSPRRGDLTDQRFDLLMLVSGVVRRDKLRCHHCGKRRVLVFDHLGTRDYHPRRLNQATRLRTYYREWVMAGRTVGMGVVASCDPCNSKRAHLHQHVYTSAIKRRRDKGGRGYTTRDYVRYVESVADDTPF